VPCVGFVKIRRASLGEALMLTLSSRAAPPVGTMVQLSWTADRAQASDDVPKVSVMVRAPGSYRPNTKTSPAA
jgi:hypothetical protein